MYKLEKMVEANAYLPEDTLIIILLMLPVKSLMRFRSVCKLWYQIISSASFIDTQRKITKDQYLLCTQSRFCALIRKEEFTHYRTYCSTPLVFALSQEFINYKYLYHYTPPKLLCGTLWCYTVKVYRSCNGLLCLTDKFLCSDIDIILLNPVIRKAKTIPKIPVELHQDDYRGAALCFGYFDDDYKVIRMSFRCGVCWVGVYSLRTDCWKITNCGIYDTFNFIDVLSICVGGVAYFFTGICKVVCFDLSDEKIDQILIPETLYTSYYLGHYHASSVEACGESIALVQIKDGYLEKWVLENRHATNDNSYTWKKTMNVTYMQSQAPNYESWGVVGTYVLRDISRLGDLYLCGYPAGIIISKVEGCEKLDLPKDVMAIDMHMGNLVLLNERTVEPLLKEETKSCSTHSMLILYRQNERIELRET